MLEGLERPLIKISRNEQREVANYLDTVQSFASHHKFKTTLLRVAVSKGQAP
jgi:hypothetical protein